MAGTPSPIPIFSQLLPPGTKVLRIMPNLPCVVQAGAMVFSRGSNAGDEEAALLKSLLSSCGLCEEVPESYIDIHTGLSGSGVAYVSQQDRRHCPGIWGAPSLLQAHSWMLSSSQVYLFAEALAEGAVKMGMPGALASRIAAQTLLVSPWHILESPPFPPAPGLHSSLGMRGEVLEATLPRFPLLEAKTKPPEGRRPWRWDSPLPWGCWDGDAICSHDIF